MLKTNEAFIPILTFLFLPKAPKEYGSTGHIVVATTSFLITEDTIVYCMDRFMHQYIDFTGPVKRFNKMVVTFYDLD
jgi:hypothetical protein